MGVKIIMLQGTGSHVGKSILTAALCRIFYQDGYLVAPFKSQNMALNSYVTKNGEEMGRAQVVQAEAAGIEPRVEMNPILLKPTGQASSQVVVLGKPIGNLSAQKYHGEWTKNAMEIIMGAWQRLTADYEVIVIEGAGSPAEVNLKDSEVVNMRIAKATNSPVILVGDVDKGGVLASLVGTLELLEPEERNRVVGFIINKFRGDVSLFQPAVDFLEHKTGKPVLGIIPYFQDLHIQEEDSQTDLLAQTSASGGRTAEKLEIAVIRLPHISNFTDFDALAAEPDVHLRYIGLSQKLDKPDLIILPGSKNTSADLMAIRAVGLDAQIWEMHQAGTPIIGICGGYQMLGRELYDPLQVESSNTSLTGLGLLDTVTTFAAEKVTCQVKATANQQGLFLTDSPQQIYQGYEIHMGQTVLGPQALPAFTVQERSGISANYADGAVSVDGLVLGSYLHGIFDNDLWRRFLLNQLRAKKGLPAIAGEEQLAVQLQREKDYNKLGQVVRDNLNIPLIKQLMGL